jgi:hypothetical protein
VGAADCATAGESIATAKLADSNSKESTPADLSGAPRPVVSWCE